MTQCGSQLICSLLSGPWWSFSAISKEGHAQAGNVSHAEINEYCTDLVQTGIIQDTLMHTLYVKFEDCLDLVIHLCKIYEICFNDCLSDRKLLEHWSQLLAFLFCFCGLVEAEYRGIILALARNSSSQTSETNYLE